MYAGVGREASRALCSSTSMACAVGSDERGGSSAARGSLALLVGLAVAVTGCWQAHSIDGEGGVRDDGGRELDAASLDAEVEDDAGDAGRDGGLRDGGLRDGGPRDGGPRDGGPFDGGLRDGGLRDGGLRDGGLRDGGLRDGGRRDGGLRDGGLRDGGLRDGGRRDGGAIDAGRGSPALRFTPGDLLFVPDRPALSVGTGSTIELWMRARGAGLVVRKGQDSGQQHHTIRLEETPTGIDLVVGWVTISVARREVRVPFTPFLDRWTHVAMAIERAPEGRLRVLLYVDLTLVATGEFPDDISDAFNTEAMVFGRFDGDLDEIRIWGSVRSISSLTDNAFRRFPAGTAGLAAYWPLQEAPAGQIALDRSLRGSDAILGELTTADDADPRWITDGAFP
jgi:hypothetical protein